MKKNKAVDQLMKMLASGVNDLHNHYPHIDKLNVFPVPDGDTGTNMNLTATNAYKDVKDAEPRTIGDVLGTFARGSIMSARGNSGVIFSQIIRGFAEGMKDATELNTKTWKKGFARAAEIAYKAVMKPVEGTILTVIRETSEKAQELDDNMDPKDFWKEIVRISNESLANTPNVLKVLRDVGVVDSGGYGLVKFLEGISDYVTNDKVISRSKRLVTNEENNLNLNLKEIEFGYCTEAIVILNDENINKLTAEDIHKKMESFGNTSTIVVLDSDILKVHTHSQTPNEVLLFLKKHGEFKNVKVENMNNQVARQLEIGKKKSTKWYETSALIVNRELKNQIATIEVVSSEKLKNYFEKELQVDLAIDGGEKMNPSTKDFLEAFAAVDAKNIYVFPNNSNVLLSAEQAAKEEKQSKIIIIPTKTIQQGMTTILNLDPEIPPAKNLKSLKNSIKHVVSFNVAKAIRTTKMNGIYVKDGDFVAFVDSHLRGSYPDLNDIFNKILAKYIHKRTEILTIFKGQNVKADQVNVLTKFLDENYDIEYELIDGGQKIYNFLISIE